MQGITTRILDPSFSSLLLESMADGVFTLDEAGRITSWNPSIERITGYTADDAIGQPCSLLNFTQCFRKSCPAGIEDCGIYEHGRLDGRECILRHKDGYEVPVIKSARLVKDDTGAFKGVVETVTDLTELENAVEHAFVLCSGRYIDVFDLPVEIRPMAYRPESAEAPHVNSAAAYSQKKITRQVA